MKRHDFIKVIAPNGNSQNSVTSPSFAVFKASSSIDLPPQDFFSEDCNVFGFYYHSARLAWSHGCSYLSNKIPQLAQWLDSCSSFYAFYGLLDGLSVSYSTMKFFCEIFTNSAKECSDVMKMLLFDPAWIVVVSICTAFIAGLSLIANYLEKFDESKFSVPSKNDNFFQYAFNQLQQVWKHACVHLKKIQTVKCWEYIRNLSKGLKNGFKGAKSFIALFLTLDILNKGTFNIVFFPISLVVGITCALNRAWNMSMQSSRKSESKNCENSLKKVKKLNSFLEEKQSYKSVLRSHLIRIKQIEVLENHAYALGITSFNTDMLNKKNAVEREKKLATALSGSKSLMNFNHMSESATKETIISKLITLLSSPELAAQQDLITSLKHAISEEEKKGKLPANYIKIKHPLVEKLNKELIRLEKLKKEANKDKIYTPNELRDLYEEEREKLKKCINDRKDEDKAALIKLMNSSKQLENFWFVFDNMLKTLSEVEIQNFQKNKQQFREEIQRLHIKLQQDNVALQAAKNKHSVEKFHQCIYETEQSIYKLFVKYDLMDSLGAKIIFNELEENAKLLEICRENTQWLLLLSNIIAGVVDSPYLYVGVMSLAMIGSTLLLGIATAGVITFCLICVMYRAYEEVEKNDACKLQQLKVNIALCDNKWKLAQNHYYKAYEKFKSDNNISVIDGTEYAKIFLQQSQRKQVLQSLIETYNQSQLARETLKKFVKPTIYGAVMYAAKDALSLYGAIASSFYAANIFLGLASIAFPSFLVIGSVMVGLIALVGFGYMRIRATLIAQQELNEKFQINIISREEFSYDIPSLPLGWADPNTDGLIKGEFFFQELHEVIRCVCSGFGGKAINLTDFLLSHLKSQEDHDRNGLLSIVVIAFTGILCVVYGAVLALRAVAKGFAKLGNNKDRVNIKLLDQINAAKESATIVSDPPILQTFSEIDDAESENEFFESLKAVKYKKTRVSAHQFFQQPASSPPSEPLTEANDDRSMTASPGFLNQAFQQSGDL